MSAPSWSLLRSRLAWIAREHTLKNARTPSLRSFSASISLPVDSQVDAPQNTYTKPLSKAPVFEDASEDYDAILTHFPPPAPTVKELMQQKLTAILPEPQAGDASLFEEESSEYTLTASPATSYVHHLSVVKLQSLIRTGRFKDAYPLLVEMQTIGATVKPSYMYEYAAVSVLRSNLSAKDKREQFTRWFSLIPPFHDPAPLQRYFAEVRFRILQSTTVALPLLKDSTLIMASKGFGDNSLMKFLPHLFTSLPPPQLLPFIAELEKRNRDYLVDQFARQGLSREAALEKAKYFSMVARGSAIRSLVYTGRVNEAINMLPNKSDDLDYTFATYDVLARKLRASRHAHYRKHLPRVEALLEARRKVQFGEESPAPTIDTESPPEHDTPAAMLRYFRANIDRFDPQRIQPSLLVSFMLNYYEKTNGRTSALRLLLARALRKNQVAAKRVVFAEMQVYRKLKRPDMVIRAFVEHFWVAGVPLGDVERHYNAVLQEEEQGHGDSVHRLTGFDRHALLPAGKLRPDLEQCTLVWEALILLAVRDSPGDPVLAILALYERCVEIGRAEAQADGADTTQPHPTRFGVPLAGATFHTFMLHLLPTLGPAFGARVVADMRALGLRPDKYIWSAYAYAYAVRDMPEEVWGIVDAFGSGATAAEWARAGEPVGANMQPDPAFYTNIIRGFLVAKNADAAQEVVQRLVAFMPMEEAAEYEPLRRVLKKLVDLRNHKAALAKQGPVVDTPVPAAKSEKTQDVHHSQVAAEYDHPPHLIGNHNLFAM